jgi:hypothetical protein
VRSCVPGRAAVRGTYFYTVIPKMALVACAHCRKFRFCCRPLTQAPLSGGPTTPEQKVWARTQGPGRGFGNRLKGCGRCRFGLPCAAQLR